MRRKVNWFTPKYVVGVNPVEGHKNLNVTLSNGRYELTEAWRVRNLTDVYMHSESSGIKFTLGANKDMSKYVIPGVKLIVGLERENGDYNLTYVFNGRVGHNAFDTIQFRKWYNGSFYPIVFVQEGFRSSLAKQ